MTITSAKKGINAAAQKDASHGGVKKPYRLHPGTKSLREIKKQQRSTSHIIPKTDINRMMRSSANKIAQKLALAHGINFSKLSKETMHEVLEMLIITEMRAGQELALHRGRKTVQAKDLRMRPRWAAFTRAMD